MAAGTTGTSGVIIAFTLLGTWKKCNIKPAAKKKCKTKIAPISMTFLLEFCNAGLKMIIKTVPVDKAACWINFEL